MPVQKRNPDAVGLLSADFPVLDEFNVHNMNILASVLTLHRDGGGRRRFAWTADSPYMETAGGAIALTEVSIADAEYFATVSGGPYVLLDGVNDHLFATDAAWQEPGANTFLVWAWCYATRFGATDMPIVSKYDTAALRSWMLYWRQATGTLSWLCNQTGAGGAADVVLDSAYAEADSIWYFVAGYFQPSTLMRIYVGASTDAALTITSLAAGVPASLFDGNVLFGIGVNFNAGAPLTLWDGRTGILCGRCNVPAATIDSHVTRLFQITRRIYT